MSLQQEILNGENRTLEYKVELPEDSVKWIKSIVAFANGAGGKFVIGVNNRREFIGIPKKTTCSNSRIVLPIRFRRCAYRR